jgi:phosphoribosylaminoimidazolecarboxamide formyltransferase/IMP cyclohydrolase
MSSKFYVGVIVSMRYIVTVITHRKHKMSAAQSHNQENIIQDTGLVSIKRALLSVSDKRDIVEFATKLSAHGVELVSTGGTYKTLKDADLKVTEVADVTEFPEMMDGRVKTLHPKIHGGLLADRSKDNHKSALNDHDIQEIDLIVVNLYPFMDTVRSGADFDTCIENIDIGGPAMIRSAAKNHAHVAVITDPSTYGRIMEELDQNDGALSSRTRLDLAENAFARTAAYDAAISNWFAEKTGDHTPPRISFFGVLDEKLRYGENPHQSAALYRTHHQRPGVASATQVQGKALSYNNLNDTDAAFELVSEFDNPCVAIIKHANPCGVAIGDNVANAYAEALKCDPVSAFGGIIALNRPITADLALATKDIFTEVMIAPSVEAEALNILSAKKNLRILTTGEMPQRGEQYKTVKTIAGGLLVQDSDFGTITLDDVKVVTDREPTEQEMQDMLFAFRVAKHVKSNAIIYAKNHATVGIGAGQMSRIDSARIAARKSEDASKAAGLEHSMIKGSVVASDAFFPFADGLISAAKAGATAVIQPGGSIRDEEVIEAANERGLAMVFTGQRHFRH